ncbi:MAG: MFS transporter [SAR202 cluster bacterium]|nr:MFS transporter [SAR202 cluster bacterium]
MAKSPTAAGVPPGPGDRKKGAFKENRYFVLSNLSIGHGITHWYSESFLVMIPTIKEDLGLTDLQIGAMTFVRNLASGLVSIPAGFAIDMVQRKWGMILVMTMLWTCVAYVLMGLAPNYWVLLLAMLMIALPGTIWHLPGIAALSQRFPDKRGFALSIHGVGGNVGNAIGPIVASALLGIFFWREIFLVYAIPAVIIAGVIWWSLQNVGGRSDKKGPDLRTRLQGARQMMRNPIIWGLLTSSLLRGMGGSAITTFVPIYLVEERGFNDEGIKLGLYFAMLTGLGTFASPILGTISDNVGRKGVLVFGTLMVGVLSIVFVQMTNDWAVLAIMAGIGLFTFSLGQIMQAAIIDIVGVGTEATAIGVVQGAQGVLAASSPLIAGGISDAFGVTYVFYYAGGITLLSTMLLFSLPLRKVGARQA